MTRRNYLVTRRPMESDGTVDEIEIVDAFALEKPNLSGGNALDRYAMRQVQNSVMQGSYTEQGVCRLGLVRRIGPDIIQSLPHVTMALLPKRYRLVVRWNGNVVMRATCTAVMAYQTAIGMANEFVSAEAKAAFGAITLDRVVKLTGKLNAEYKDETGAASVVIVRLT